VVDGERVDSTIGSAYIVLEGPDYAGKTTQAKVLADYLRAQGKDVVSVHQPGYTFLGKRIRQVVKDPNLDMCNKAERFMFAADHADTVSFIREKLAEGKVVISDRCSLISNLSYGIARGNIDEAFLDGIEELIITPQIDLLVVFNITLETQKQRIPGRTPERCRIEEAGDAYMKEVIRLYNMMSTFNMVGRRSKEIAYIDGEKSIEEVSDVIRSHVDLLAL
jgi:dTMP kinase